MSELEEVREENQRLRALLSNVAVLRIALEENGTSGGKTHVSWICTAVGMSEQRVIEELKDYLIAFTGAMTDGAKVETDGVVKPMRL